MLIYLKWNKGIERKYNKMVVRGKINCVDYGNTVLNERGVKRVTRGTKDKGPKTKWRCKCRVGVESIE
jgi:hypothetical protein